MGGKYCCELDFTSLVLWKCILVRTPDWHCYKKTPKNPQNMHVPEKCILMYLFLGVICGICVSSGFFVLLSSWFLMNCFHRDYLCWGFSCSFTASNLQVKKSLFWLNSLWLCLYLFPKKTNLKNLSMPHYYEGNRKQKKKISGNKWSNTHMFPFPLTPGISWLKQFFFSSSHSFCV